MQILDDEALVARLFDRDEQAIGDLQRKYEKLCMSVALGILADERDARECVGDAYLRVWNTIPPKRPESLKAYVCAITRHLALDRYDYNTAAKRSSNLTQAFEELEGDISSGEPAGYMGYASADGSAHRGSAAAGGDGYGGGNADDGFSVEFADVLNGFLKDLKKDARVFFVRRYWYGQSIKQIAEAYDVSEDKVKVSLYRTRKKLQTTLRKEGIAV